MKRDRILRPLTPLLAWLARAFIRFIAATWRWTIVGEDRLEGLAARPAVYAFWHGQLLPCGDLLDRQLRRRRGVPLAVFVSLSRDGELMARVVRGRGLSAVRGSTSRAGLQGLRQLHRSMAREGRSVLTAPDGPRGPAGVPQPGATILAQTAKAPLVPVAAAASRAWRVNSWDRMMIPKPFARVSVVIGEPRGIERGCNLEQETAELGRRLDLAAAEAKDSVGRTNERNETADSS